MPMIGLAQALINDPDLLILDEPTAGLDPIGIRQIKDVIRELAGKGKTILLSSHLLADVEDVCDRITILYGGRKRASGPIGELLSRDDRTQITTDKLSDEVIEKIRRVVGESEGKRVLHVGSPSDRLETFFMRTIEQAEAANVRSSGARRSGALPDFLGSSVPRDVIGGLISSAGEQAATAAAETLEAIPAEPREKPSVKVIDRLTKESNAAGASVGGAEEPEELPPSEELQEDRSGVREADRGVIDGLLGGGRGEDRSNG